MEKILLFNPNNHNSFFAFRFLYIIFIISFWQSLYDLFILLKCINVSIHSLILFLSFTKVETSHAQSNSPLIPLSSSLITFFFLMISLDCFWRIFPNLMWCYKLKYMSIIYSVIVRVSSTGDITTLCSYDAAHGNYPAITEQILKSIKITDSMNYKYSEE